jgi:ubiquinone/menaquinone biosynthesis C-methylase UbiE
MRLTVLLAISLAAVVAPQVAQVPPRPPDVIFVPTDSAVVDAMLTLAKVTKNDLVYDLGCGDGRIVIAAAKARGARGVGIDIDPARIQEAIGRARTAGVSDRVRFVLGDIFDPAVTIRDATVVTLFLLPDLNRRLRPRLQRELKPGTRVVSNSFDMGPEWPADRTAQVGTFTIYFWEIRKTG